MSNESQLQSREGRRLLAELRRAISRLPEVEEIIDGFGHTTFKVRKKSFIIAGTDEEGCTIVIKCDPIAQRHLIQRGPYYRTPYIGQHGWVSIADPLKQDWAELRGLIEDAYRRAAPKTLARLVS